MKKLALMLILVGGCSLNNGSPGDGLKPDWDAMGPKIQTRVKYVAAFAFTMDQVKPYKAQVCETTEQIVELLNTYNDKDASFDTVRAAVMNLIAQIENEDVRNAVSIFVDMVLTESFNYAWEHYSDWIERDEVQTAIIIARAVGNGLNDACDLVMSVTSMSSPDGHYAYRAFTVPRRTHD